MAKIQSKKSAKEPKIAGRPRKYDLSEEAQKLDLWSKQPDSYSIYEFTYDKDYCAQELTRFCKESEIFSLGLKKAKERLVVNRERAVHAGVFNYGIYNRNARVYDYLLREQENEDAELEVRRKKDILTSTPSQINIHVDKDLGAGLNIQTSGISATSD